RLTEMFQRRQMRETAWVSQRLHPEGLFERETGRHDFPEETCNIGIRKRSCVLLHDIAQDLGFSLRPIEVDRYLLLWLASQCAGLDCGDLRRKCRTLIDERQQLQVYLIDLLTQI